MQLQDLLKEHRGPPVNIEAIVRGLGVELNKDAELPEHISGQLELLGSGTYKISTNKQDHYFRKRFTIAHELAHFLLHRHLVGKGVDDDRLYRSTARDFYGSSGIRPEHEIQANRLAVLFLMPTDAIQRLIGNGITEAADLAKRFQVSPKAMEIRLQAIPLAV